MRTEEEKLTLLIDLSDILVTAVTKFMQERLSKDGHTITSSDVGIMLSAITNCCVGHLKNMIDIGLLCEDHLDFYFQDMKKLVLLRMEEGTVH